MMYLSINFLVYVWWVVCSVWTVMCETLSWVMINQTDLTASWAGECSKCLQHKKYVVHGCHGNGMLWKRLQKSWVSCSEMFQVVVLGLILLQLGSAHGYELIVLSRNQLRQEIKDQGSTPFVCVMRVEHCQWMLLLPLNWVWLELLARVVMFKLWYMGPIVSYLGHGLPIKQSRLLYTASWASECSNKVL